MAIDKAQIVQEVEELRPVFKDADFCVYAMSLHLPSIDPSNLGHAILTDGKDDKKTDFFFVDEDGSRAIIAQAYRSQNWDKANTKDGKVGEISIAVNWLLESDLEDIPRDDIRDRAVELREGIATGTIKQLDLIFCHNLRASEDVSAELRTAELAATTLTRAHTTDGNSIKVMGVEVSLDTVIQWRQVQDEFISVKNLVEVESVTPLSWYQTDNWNAAIATLKSSQLRAWLESHGDQLFSANVRDPLEIRKTAKNINHQMKTTAEQDPSSFWAFNNGITIVSRKLEAISDHSLQADGISIINGAQTTHCLCDAAPTVPEPEVVTRFVAAEDVSFLESITRFTNSQNPVKSWDLRSGDAIQKKIQSDLDDLGVKYHRRRGQGRRPIANPTMERVGPYLTAGLGDVKNAAYRTRIFEDDLLYNAIFNEHTAGRHVLFADRIGQSIVTFRGTLREKIHHDDASDIEKGWNSIFRHTNVPHILARLSYEFLCMLGGKQFQKAAKRVFLSDTILLDTEASADIFPKIIQTVIAPLARIIYGLEDPQKSLKNESEMNEICGKVISVLEVSHETNPDMFSIIRQHVEFS